MKLAKRLAAIGAAVMMMGTMAISASAYSASYIGETSKSTSTSRHYISCYHVGSFTSGNVNGTAWTKTSTTKSTFNPDCNFNGYISVVTACGSVHGNKNNQYANV
jgi:hypothetical protein